MKNALFYLFFSFTVEVSGGKKMHSPKKCTSQAYFYYSNRHFLTYTLFPILSKVAHGFTEVSACISKHVETAHQESYVAIIAMEDS